MMEAGSDDFIRKPCQPDESFDCIASLLDVEFIYEDTGELSKHAVLPKVRNDELKDLPDEWRDQFLNAARLGDTKAMLTLTETLDTKHSKVKSKLQYHIVNSRLNF